MKPGSVVGVVLAVVVTMASPLLADERMVGFEWQNLSGGALRVLDRTTGADLATINANIVEMTDNRGMALDPTTGVVYAVTNVSGFFLLNTIDITTGAMSVAGGITESVRDITFDDTGQMWAVVGRFSSTLPNTVIAINKSNGSVGAALGTTAGDRQQAIAFRPADQSLYVYASDGDSPNYTLKSFALPGGAATTITVSGTPPSDKIKGMTYDPTDDVFRFFHFTSGGSPASYATVSPSGVQTTTGHQNTTIYFGLVFDWFTTKGGFADGFESGDLSNWSP